MRRPWITPAVPALAEHRQAFTRGGYSSDHRRLSCLRHARDVRQNRLGRLTFLRHACDVTVGIKLDPVSAFFDGRHALRVSSSCMYRRCPG
jgi:hypothetical protein